MSPRWAARARERVSRFLPNAVTLYPFEVIVVVLMLLTGGPILLGLTSVPILVALVGKVAFYVWGGAMVLAGGTVGVGLWTKHSLALSSGLQLSAVCLVVFLLAVAVLVGLAAWPTLVIHGVITLVALVRSLHFRRLVDIQKGATALKERGR